MTDSMAGGKLYGRAQSIKSQKYKHNPILRRSGVYEIVCIVTGKRYIGSTAKSFRSRFGSHKCELRAGKHHSRHLQRAWNKHGEGAFQFNPLIFCEPNEVLTYEQMLIEAFNPEFNISPTAGNAFGVKHTEETRRKYSAGAKRAWLSGKHANRDMSGYRTPEYSALRSSITRRLWENGAFANKPPRAINTGAKYEVNGEELTIRQIAEKYNFNPGTIQFRIASGLRGNDLIAPLWEKHAEAIRAWKLNNPEADAVRIAKATETKRFKYDIRGEMLSKYDIAKKYGFKIWTINRRIERGLRGEELIAPLHPAKGKRRDWNNDHARRKNAKRYLVHGENLTIHELSVKYGLDKKLLFDRRKRGVSGDDLVRQKQVRP